MTTLARSAVRAFLAMLPLVAVLFTSAPAAAQSLHLYKDLFNSCASQIDAMPTHARIPIGRTSAIVHPRVAGGPSPATCSEMNWVKLKGKIVSIGIQWAGAIITNAGDCGHSTLSWALYGKNGSAWQRIGGGASFGNIQNGVCTYDMTAEPQLATWGTFAQSTGVVTDQEYRVAFWAWSHDDPTIGHNADRCADPENCSWPVKIKSGTVSKIPRQDYTVYRPGDGTFYMLDSVSGAQASQNGGQSSDIPAPGDYDGDYQSDFARTRNLNGQKTWHIANTTGGSWSQQWGGTTDVPLSAGDFDGDGKSDIAVWRPSNGVWYIINSINWGTSERQWGAPEDKPVIGLFDEDLRTDIAVWRPSNGVWYVQKSLSSIWTETQWGAPSDQPVPADFDGDFITDQAVWRWSNGTFYWISSKTGAGLEYQLGEDGDRPIPGYYDDDLMADYAVFRWDGGRWIYTSSKTGSSSWTQWGDSFNLPVVPFRRGT